jgi:uncharacterized protein
LRMQLLEEHWSFMDGYADGMIARGPTLAEDGETATGSLHIVDLPDAEAVRAFVFEEPNYRAGVYAEVLIRRFRNLLGRTMWEFGGDPDASRFLVIAHGRPGASEASLDFEPGASREWLILCGPLLSEDGSAWVGDAFAVDSPVREEAEALIGADPLARAHLYERVEIHPWRFGGRR